MTRLVIAAIGAASVLASTAPAAAQGRYETRRDGYGAYYEARRSGYENGYREGLKEGERDGRRHEAFAYTDERTYQRADKGYRRHYGDFDHYRQAFRSGYVDGYNQGYRRSGYRDGNGRGRGRGRGWGLGRNDRDFPARGAAHPALEYGANDGYEKGIEDAREGRSFDVLRHKWYRSGDRHYDRRYGSREEYEDLYREGFRRGYERGYRQARW